MGNCLVLVQQDMLIRVMKDDGKILEYKAPIKVHEVLKQFPGHAISESLPHHLHHNTRLLQGQLYFLVPPPPPSPSPPCSSKVCMKRVRFAEPDNEVEEGGVVRVKLVVSKQELKDLLRNGGICVKELLSLVKAEKGIDVCKIKDDNHASQGWKPSLETIPE